MWGIFTHIVKFLQGLCPCCKKCVHVVKNERGFIYNVHLDNNEQGDYVVCGDIVLHSAFTKF